MHSGQFTDAVKVLQEAMTGFENLRIEIDYNEKAIKAVGDNPNSVDAQGLSVYGLRIGAIVAGSALMALGGAFLTMSAFDAFFFGNIRDRFSFRSISFGICVI